jgi:hypothetical protein
MISLLSPHIKMREPIPNEKIDFSQKSQLSGYKSNKFN